LSSIYDLHSDTFYSLILRIVWDDEIAKGVLQESFMKIWKKAKELLAGKSFLFYLDVGHLRKWIN
jgi:DNA-directed RNA polymerase specialized sigma24 family protein